MFLVRFHQRYKTQVAFILLGTVLMIFPSFMEQNAIFYILSGNDESSYFPLKRVRDDDAFLYDHSEPCSESTGRIIFPVA